MKGVKPSFSARIGAKTPGGVALRSLNFAIRRLKCKITGLMTVSVSVFGCIGGPSPSLIRCLILLGSRLDTFRLNRDAIHSVIFQARHYMVDPLVQRAHVVKGHVGENYVRSTKRKPFWIVSKRVTEKRVIKRVYYAGGAWS